MLERKCAYFKGGGGEGEWKQASARKRVNSEDKYREYGISFIDQSALEYLWTLWGFLFDPVQEAEDIKKKWQEYTKELYKKDLHDPDNHNGVIIDLECEVKWALESITTNKASGGDGIPVELFQILTDDAVKVLHSICQQIWKTQQWPQDWKRSVFIPIPKESNA